MLLTTLIWVVSIAIVVQASRKATEWTRRWKVWVGVGMVIPTVLVAVAISQAIVASFSDGFISPDTSEVMTATGFSLAAMFLILYFIFAAIYRRFGGHRDEARPQVVE